MERVLTLYQSTIGKKAVMAVSGVVLVGFVVGHLLGNLQLFGPPELINAYSEKIHSMPPLLWGTRVVLLLAVVSHTWAAVSLMSRNADARPVEYKKKQNEASTYASRWMRWSGPIVLFYIAYHLMHLTLKKGIPPEYAENLYDQIVWSFQQPAIVATYIIANTLLALHLRHGVWSMLQTLGLNHPQWNPWRDRLAWAIAGFIFLGNVGIPAAVFAGVIKPSAERNADIVDTDTAQTDTTEAE